MIFVLVHTEMTIFWICVTENTLLKLFSLLHFIFFKLATTELKITRYFFKIYLFLFIYFWLCWVFVAARGLSLVAVSGGYSSLQCAGFSLRWLLSLWSTGSRHAGFSSCGTRAQQLWLTGSRAQAQQLWRTGLVTPRHVGSSRTRARTRVPCIGRRILNHCATREAPTHVILNSSTALDNNLKMMGWQGRREDCSYTKVVNI